MYISLVATEGCGGAFLTAATTRIDKVVIWTDSTIGEYQAIFAHPNGGCDSMRGP